MHFAEALTILRKDAEEERNWRSARSKIQEVLEAAIQADSSLQACCDKEARSGASVAALETQRDALHRTLLDLQRQVSTCDATLAEKKQDEAAALAEVRAQRQAEDSKLADVRTQLAELKTKLP